MAFRYSGMGEMVGRDPASASAELSEKMEANGSNMGVVAGLYGVHRDTLARWYDQLATAGHPVTGRGAAKRGRKPGRKGEEEQEEAVQAPPPPPAAPAPRGRVRRSPAPSAP